MDPVTGFFTCTQAAVYFARTIACLLDLCKCIKNSKTIASQYYSSIAQLYDIIIRISSSEYIPITDNLRDILVSIEETARVLKRRLIEGTRLKVTAILLTRQYSLGELLASLERQKSTLVLYLTTENTSATYELATCQSLGFQSMNYLRVGKKVLCSIHKPFFKYRSYNQNKTSKRTLSDEHSGLMPDLRSSANRGIPRDPLINKEPMDSLVLVGEGSGTLIEDDKVCSEGVLHEHCANSIYAN